MVPSLFRNGLPWHDAALRHAVMKFTRTIAAFTAFALVSSATVSAPLAAKPVPVRTQSSRVQPFVIAANPIAARAGMDIIERGGSAIDAAVAIEATLSLVEPQSSGLGGGTFITYFDAARGKITIYDGRETAPAQASPTMFLDGQGKPLPFAEAVVSGRATGVPGAVAALALAQREHGKLPWARLFKTATSTAEQGFIVSPRLGRFLGRGFPQLKVPEAKAYFSRPDGTPLQVGDRLKNPDYAKFLRRLAAQGPSAFYRGSTAARIVQRTRAAPLGGTMTMADLAAYRVVKREPVCAPYRQYKVCVPPPPSSGAGFLQLLGLLERTDIAKRGPFDPQAWYLFSEASRLMYADRDTYIGDADFVPVPVAGLLDPAYLDQRAKLIGPRAAPNVAAGVPKGAVRTAPDHTLEPAGTTHFIVRDARGNVVSMTATVESIFGTGRMVDGFFLNNEMTDFSFAPTMPDGSASPNAVAPRKRPRSSMIPLILLDSHGQFAGAIGSAGGNSILAYVGKSLVAAVDWDLPMQQAIALPNLIARGNRVTGEVSRFSPELIAALAALGVTVLPGEGEDSGVQGVLIRDGRIDGGYDPRREGVVLVGKP
jgi:gamma-glutamyltranspeptidase / glutathione hydrolase